MCMAGSGCESVGAHTAAAGIAAAYILPRAREGPCFDRATTPTHLARDGHRARKRWSVPPADVCMLPHSASGGRYICTHLSW